MIVRLSGHPLIQDSLSGPFVSGTGGPIMADSAVCSDSPETLPLDQVLLGCGLVGDLSDVELSGGYCMTSCSRAGGVASATGRAPSTRAA